MWTIEFYESSNGRRPVEDFIDSLDARSKARVAKTLDLLEEFGTGLGMSFSKHLKDQLWELRMRQGRSQYRIIYFLVLERTFVLLHAFTKKTSAVSGGVLATAAVRRDDYLYRRKRVT